MAQISLIVSIVPKGWGDTVVEASVEAGARGGTVLFGRGSGVNEKQKIFGIRIEPEKEIVLTLAVEGQTQPILDAIVKAAKLDERGNGLTFVVPVESLAGVSALALQAPVATDD